MSAGDYRLFCSGTAQIRSLETDRQFAKARHWRAFLRVLGTFSLSAGLVGWSERIRTRAFPIEPGLCASSLEFGNMAGVRPGARISHAFRFQFTAYYLAFVGGSAIAPVQTWIRPPTRP
jgi:hypothetical protein